MDPLTITGALAGIKMANSAFAIIKETIRNGRDVTDCASALSKWVAGCSAVQKEHSQKTARLGSSASERAVETLIHIQTIQRQRDELREFLQLYGKPGSWNQFIQLEREYRLQARKEKDVADQKNKKKREIIIAGLIVLFITGVLSLIGFMVYLVITEGNL
jgi:hypothetical protein